MLGRVGPGSAGASGCAARAPQRLSNRHVAPGGGRTAAHPWAHARAHTRARAHVLKTYRTGGAGTTLATAGRLIPPALGTGALSGRGSGTERDPCTLLSRGSPPDAGSALRRPGVHWGLPGPDLRAPRRPQPQGGTWSAGGGEAGPGTSLTASGFRSRRSRASAPFSGLRFLSQRGRGAGWLSARTLCLS